MSEITIRRVEQGDLPALLAIYNYYVRETPVSFDIEPRTLEQRQDLTLAQRPQLSRDELAPRLPDRRV